MRSSSKNKSPNASSVSDRAKRIAPEIKTTIIEIAKLKVEPGDILVIKVPKWRDSKLDVFCRGLGEFLPEEVRFLVLDNDADMAILSYPDAVKRAWPKVH